MRLATFNDRHIGRVQGDEIVDLCALVGVHCDTDDRAAGLSPMRRLIERWETIETSAAEVDSPATPLSAVTLNSPVPDPTKILAAPVNYADHQVEMSVDAHVSSLGLFLKAPSSLAAPGGTVRLPYSDRRFDQEGELAVIIGKDAYRIQSDPLDVVFGYTGLLDITMRGGEDRSTRKSFATFTPMGPWIVTAAEFGDPESVDLRCTVNGVLRQSANTRELIWGVAKLVEYASWIGPLRAGDVITTGTPAGVDALANGDEVELTLTGLGAPLTARVTDERAVLSHTFGHNAGPKPPVSTRGHR